MSAHTFLPNFNAIEINTIVDDVKKHIQQIEQQIQSRLAQSIAPTWQNLVAPLEEWQDGLNQFFSPISHLNSVKDSKALREAYGTAIELLSEFYTAMGQNQALYQAYVQLAASDEFSQYTPAQRQTIEQALRDFTLSGVGLTGEAKTQFAKYSTELAKLQQTFSENVLDATQSWTLLIDDENKLDGLPDSAKAMLKNNAKAAKQEGWLINLQIPSWMPVMQFAHDRDLRETCYRAYVARASEIGSDAGKFDNSQNIEQILTKRVQKAKLLHFNNYAELSVASKMATSTDQVIEFLTQLAEKSRPQALAEFAELQQFAADTLGLSDLQPWDVSYASEKYRLHLFDFSEEAIRPWFPASKVLDGLFAISKQLFGIEVVEQSSFETYHPDVQFFEIRQHDKTIAYFYLDMYARDAKRGGAWMDVCRQRRITLANELQLPVAYLCCNFSPAINGEPALLRHSEVTTLFHEFGHGIQHMLTKIDIASVSGINGIAWDAVELPSQFMENFCWVKEGLDLISGHYQNQEPLPKEWLDKLLAAKNFQSAMMMMRQLEFSLFDFKLHCQFAGSNALDTLNNVLAEVRAAVTVVPVIAENRFAHSFSHIFAGGYGAGYYSYKWPEVLSADAFAAFEEAGIFDAQTGQRFADTVLALGGSYNADDVYRQFRGRDATIDALLRHSGIAA